MYLIKAESQRQVLIITFMYLFVILFFNLLQTQYLAIYCNMQYIDILYWPYCIVLYCSSEYCNIAIFRYTVSPLVHTSYTLQTLDKGQVTATSNIQRAGCIILL